MSEEQDSAPKLQVDSDWKASAQAEKERLQEKEEARKAEEPQQHTLPEATMMVMIDMLASQAVMALGAMADPDTGKAVVDLQGAKLAIDLLLVLQEKTKNNLTEEESKHLSMMLPELRARFVQIVQLIGQQQGAAAPGNPGDPGDPGDQDVAATEKTGNSPTIELP